jgi:hypothetical protein
MTSNRYLEQASIDMVAEAIRDHKLTGVEWSRVLNRLADVIVAARNGEDRDTIMAKKLKLADKMDYYLEGR